MNSIQQNGRKEMLTDEQASSWKKAIGFSAIAVPKQFNFNRYNVKAQLKNKQRKKF